MDTTLEVLRAGRDWLREDPRRWSSKGFGTFPENGCAVTALKAGGVPYDRENPACPHYGAHMALLDAVVAEGEASIMCFNDSAATGLDDVLRVYDRAITKLSPETVPQATPRRRDDVGCVVSGRAGAAQATERSV